MKNESKNTLISLSLAGAIGHYLYSKLMKANGTDVVYSQNLIDESSVVKPVQEDHVIDAESPVVEEVVVDTAITENQDTEEPEDDVVEDGVVCSSCEFVNGKDDKFCNNCGASLREDELPIAPSLNFDNFTPISIPDIQDESTTGNNEESPDESQDESVLPVVESVNPDPVVEEPVVEEPVVNPVLTPIVEEAPDAATEHAVLNDNELDDNDADTSVDDLFDAVKEDEPQMMDNVEPLHKVDKDSASAKKEFKSILDFFKTL
jgi:hypothetical protein